MSMEFSSMVDTMSRVPDYYCMTFDEAEEDDHPSTSQVKEALANYPYIFNPHFYIIFYFTAFIRKWINV